MATDINKVEIVDGMKVKRVQGGLTGGMSVGDTGIVTRACGVDIKMDKNGSLSTGHSASNLEVININIMTNIKDVIKLAFKGEPEKSLIKAGITDSNDVFTTDGREVFLQWLLKNNGISFKKEIVDVILAEKEKETKCS